MRWVIGDLHGCVHELDDFLRVVRFDPHRDRLYCTGDLVNKGPAPTATLRLFRSVGGRAVLGNHDVYTVLVASGTWARGRRDTLDPFFEAADADEHLAYLRDLPLLRTIHDRDDDDQQNLDPDPASDADDALPWLVHAGVHARWRRLAALAAHFNRVPRDNDALRDPAVRYATTVRCVDPVDGALIAGSDAVCPDGAVAWDSCYRGRATLVYGHWAMRGHHRRPARDGRGAVLGLDSGCVYGGGLTGWCVEEDRIVRVPTRRSTLNGR